MAGKTTTSTSKPFALRRRDVLKTGVAGILFPSASVLRAAEQTDVTVLGAGLAGLYSAMLLEDLGYSVTVLEASGTVGGRVQTRVFGGIRWELGASEIDVLYARLIDTARRLNIPLGTGDMDFKPLSYHIGGTLLRADQWESANVNRTVGDERAIAPLFLELQTIRALNPLENLDSWLQAENSAVDIPLSTYLKSRGVSQAAVDLIGHTYNGPDINRTSALTVFRDSKRALAGYEAWQQRKAQGADIPSQRTVTGGMQQLPEAMAASLQGEVRLNSPAARVEQDATGVTVTCRDGSRYRSSRIISAIPIGAMRNIDFAPGLSEAKMAAIQNCDYYKTTKFYLRPTEPFWEQDGFDPGLWSDGVVERVFALAEKGGDVHTLLVWINGASTDLIDKLDPREAGEMVLAELARIRPASKGKLEVMGHHAWGRDEFAVGCGFSYAAGQVTALASDLPRPEGRVFFAGEHTRRLESGMEGAMESAGRAVQELATADMA